jgi:hypothetical protein
MLWFELRDHTLNRGLMRIVVLSGVFLWLWLVAALMLQQRQGL